MDDKHDIRWMFRKDMSYIKEMEHDSYDRSMMAYEIEEILKGRNSIGKCIVSSEEAANKQYAKPLGYMIYNIEPDEHRMELVRLLIAKQHRRQGLGTQLLRHLTERIDRSHKYHRLNAASYGEHYAALMLLKKIGMTVTKIYHGDVGTDDVLEFSYEKSRKANRQQPALSYQRRALWKLPG